MLDLRELGRRVETARKAGAMGVELLLTSTTGHDLTCERGKVSETPVSESSATVRVWVDGGGSAEVVGSAEQVDALIDKALTRAGKAKDNAFSGPVDRLNTLPHGLGISDRRYDQVEAEDRAEVLIDAEKSVKQVDRRVAASGFVYRSRKHLRRFVNSKDVRLEEWSTTYESEGTVTAGVSGEQITLHDLVQARTFASIASLPYGINLARRAVDLLQTGETLDGEIKAMLPPRVVARIFGALGTGFVDSAFDDPSSFFLQPREDGEPVISPKLHLVDDGTLPGGFRTQSFDDRGVSPVPLTLLREGRVAGRFIGAEAARRLDVRPTGHLRGGRLQPTNLMMRGGTRSMNATFTDHDTWSLWVDDLDPADIDLATGLVRTTLSGQVMKSNEPRGALRNVPVLIDLSVVLDQVLELCSDTDRIGHVDVPGLFVDGITLV